MTAPERIRLDQLARAKRRNALIRKHQHTPQLLPHPNGTAEALRLLQKRAELHPNDCCAFAYATEAEAIDWGASNRRHNGHTIFGPKLIEGIGWIDIIDFRKELVEKGGILTDPRLPDFVPPPPKKPRT